MPASFHTKTGTPGSDESPLASCRNCGTVLALPKGLAQSAVSALAEAESARCARLGEIAQQRHALAVRIQAGIAGIVGSDRLETNDLVVHRRSLAQLEETLKAEFEDLSKIMLHKPHEARKKAQQ